VRRARRARKHRRQSRRAPVGSALLLIVLGLAGFASGGMLTASATVPVSYAVKNTRAIAAADLRPSDCASLTLTTTVRGSGPITATGGTLVLASSGADTITASGGNNCIVGGAGTDTVTVSAGTAVCVISTPSTQTGCTTVVRRP
jgi:Ca2+-binding RTX toxin-like protein